MNLVARLLLLMVVATQLSSVHAMVVHRVPVRLLLSTLDRQQGGVASMLAARAPRSAWRWIQRQRGVGTAQLGPDGETIDVHFRDGAEVVVVPRAPRTAGARPAGTTASLNDQRAVGSPAQRAAVLEPFADEASLKLSPDAGRVEANALTAAGFQVDLLRNQDVTVRAMASLSSHSVVYLQTHSGTLPGGDALIVTGETDTAQFAAQLQERSIVQAYVAGDPTKTLYDGITSLFVTKYIGTFPTNSVVFINGCSVLDQTAFWGALHSHGVATMLGWDHDVSIAVNDAAGGVVFGALQNGLSVAESIVEAGSRGDGKDVVDNVETHLGFVGDGDETFSRILGERPAATATWTPTLTPVGTGTAAPAVPALGTPTATPLTGRQSHLKCRRGHRAVKRRCRVKPQCRKRRCGKG